MIKARKLNVGIKVAFILLSVVIFFTQVQKEEPKQNIEEFLQNIKDVIKKLYDMEKEKAKKKKSRRMKKKMRKKILQKLTNPYWRMTQHWEIKIKKPEEIQQADNITKTPYSFGNTNQKTNLLLQRTINTFLEKNPHLFSFQFSHLEQAIAKLKNNKAQKWNRNSTNADNTQDYSLDESNTYKAVVNIYSQMIESLVNFWAIVWKLIGNEARFGYIKEKLCSGEVSEKAAFPMDIFLLGRNDKENFVAPMSIAIQRVLSLEWQTFYIEPFAELQRIFPKEYLLYKTLSSPSENPSYISPSFEKSLCYNLSVFVYRGGYLYLRKKSIFDKMNKCLLREENGKFCKRLSVVEINLIISTFQKYFSLGAMILKKQIIPTLFKMCSIECLCNDFVEKCNKGKLSEQESLQEKIAVLLYDLFIKKPISLAPMLHTLLEYYDNSPYEYQLSKLFAEFKNLLTDNKCHNEITYLKNTFEKLRKELVEKIQVFKKKVNFKEVNIIDQSINFINSGDFNKGLLNLQQNVPHVFSEIVTSPEINVILQEFKNLFGLKDKVLQQKDICAVVILAMMGTLGKDFEAGQDILRFISERNLDGILFMLNELELLPIMEGEDPYNLDDLLRKLVGLPYLIYRDLSILKLSKCYKANISYMEGIKWELGIYNCIFKDDLSLSCLFNSATLSKSPLKKIVESLQSKLDEMDEFIQKLDGKKAVDFSSDYKQWCENGNVKVCSTLTKILTVDNAGGINVFCMEDKHISQYCPDTLVKCPPYTNSSTYCYEKVESGYKLRLNCKDPQDEGCSCKNECQTVCKFLNYLITGKFDCIDATISKELLEKIGYTIDKICVYLRTSIAGCCSLQRSDERHGDPFYFVELTKKSAYCQKPFEADAILKEGTQAIVSKMGKYYLQILKSRIKNLRQLWNSKEKCLE
jgi:hypothetical protein